MNYNIQSLIFECESLENCIEVVCRLASGSFEVDFRSHGTKISLLSNKNLSSRQIFILKELIHQNRIRILHCNDITFLL